MSGIRTDEFPSASSPPRLASPQRTTRRVYTQQTTEPGMTEEGRSPEGIEPAPAPLPDKTRNSGGQAVDWFGLTESNLPRQPDSATPAIEPVLQVPALSCTGGLRP